MASLYEQLMASKGAPKADAAPNSTQLRKAPVSLRSAMRKYAMGGDVEGGTTEGGSGNSPEQQQAAMMAALQMAQQAQQGTPFGMSPPPRNDFERFKQDIQPPMRPPEEPRYEEPRPDPRPEPRYPDEIPPRPRVPDLETPYIAPQQPQGPRTSYRQNDDGSLEEIGYDGQPVSGYTPEQMAKHLATTGAIPSDYRYVWNGEGYDKLPNGPQIGYNPEPPPPPPPEDPRETPQYYEPEVPQYPDEPSYYQPPVDYNPPPPQRVSDTPGIAEKLARLLATGQKGTGALQNQQQLMELLASLKGK